MTQNAISVLLSLAWGVLTLVSKHEHGASESCSKQAHSHVSWEVKWMDRRKHQLILGEAIWGKGSALFFSYL